jgi:PAS domain S-box-containing protein
MVGCDREGHVVFWNVAAEALFGWTAEEAVGRVPPFVPPALRQEWQLQTRQVLETGDPTPAAETQRVTRDGRTIWVIHSASAVRSADGRIVGVLDTSIDVTTLKQQDEESRALTRVRERELIAMDLHDGLIQSLYAVVLNLAAKEFPHDDAVSALKAIRAEAEQIIEETRAYLLHLRTPELTPRSLVSGLQVLADGLRLNAGVTVLVTIDPKAEGLLSEESRGHVLYLVREAVSNVLRHASASVVRIELARSVDRVIVRVLDNGRGFDPSAHRGARHHGLYTMAERARLIGGQLNIVSEPGQGTRVCLAVAYPS